MLQANMSNHKDALTAMSIVHHRFGHNTMAHTGSAEGAEACTVFVPHPEAYNYVDAAAFILAFLNGVRWTLDELNRSKP